MDLIIKVCSPIWTKHGFALSFGLFEAKKEDHLGIKCTISHSAGHSRVEMGEFELDDSGLQGKKNKTKTHASGSTMSYFRRYLTCMIFNIATQDDDDGTAGNSVSMIDRITPDQVATLNDVIESKNFDDKMKAKFYSFLRTFYNATCFEKVSSKDYDEVLKRLEDSKPGDANAK